MSAQATPAEAHDDPGPHDPGPHDPGPHDPGPHARGPHVPGPHDADTQGYQLVLHDLIAMGADLARLLHGQAATQAAQAAAHPTQKSKDAQQTPDAPPIPASDALISLTLAFDRIARAVRRSILLARTLAAPIPPAPDPARHRAAARRRIIREVEDAIQRTGSAASDERDSAETLHAELRDRLDTPDLNDDLITRPPAEIISEICRDLGLAAPPGGAHPWKRRTPQDITQLCADAAAPSGVRQPAAGPQGRRRDTAQPTPDPHPDKPAASSRTQPGPIPAGSDPTEETAGTIAMILRHPAPVHGRWRPPRAP